jgi:hypothetical protein
MGLMDMLRKLGDRLGILELSPAAQPSSPVKVQTRTITLAELVMNIRITEVRELAEAPAELSVSFEDVFKAAGIQPGPTGWTVDRLKEFLSNERIRKMDRGDAQRETLAMLAAEKVDSADLIKDAISRDRALDAFEESMSKKRPQWQAGQKQLLSELASRIRSLEQQRKGVEQEIADEEKKWADWRRRKRQNEVDMAHAIGYLIDRPVISIGEE